MPMLRHPDIAALGGPVPQGSVDFWRDYGFEPVSEEEAQLAAIAGDPNASDYESLTKDQLLGLAAARGVEVSTRSTKADIIAAIEAAE